MDEELEAIVEIEKKLEDLAFEAKHRVVDFVKARIKYDHMIEQPGMGLVKGATLNQQAQKSK